MKRIIAALLFVLLYSVSYGQVITGRVVDQNSGEPLAFVHIVVNDSRAGTTTDIDGAFELRYKQVESLTVSYVGYVRQRIVLSDYLSTADASLEKMTIHLRADTRVLQELVFEAGENPAHPIIRQVVKNRKINNPEKIKSFQYKSYNKFHMDAEGMEDDDEEFQDFIATKYLFLMESVTERKFLKPNRSKEIVLANRVSGFKNPLFTTLANSFQPFSFYGDYITVAGKNYLNPISSGTLNKYFFELQDSIYSKGHKVYIISFEPQKKNFDGLKGLLYINTYKYAVENVIAETANLADHLNKNLKVEVDEEHPSKGVALEIEDDTTQLAEHKPPQNSSDQIKITFKIQQMYDLVDDSLWFPSQLNTDITMGEAAEGGSALQGVGRSYLSEIEILPDIRPREFDRLAVEFDPKANKRDSLFWNTYRVVPIDDRGLATYDFIDSVAEEAHLERYVTGFAMLTTGKLRAGKIDFDLNQVIGYNRFESVRLGVGAHTNSLFSQIFNVGGYGAYGFGDKAFKYGGDINFFLTRKNELTASFLYQNDVSEFAGTSFYLDNNPLSSETNRKFMIANMDYIENTEGAVSFYFLKYMDTRLSFSKKTRQVTSSYTYVPSVSDLPVLVNEFQLAEASVQLKYSFREQFVEVFGNKVSTGVKYPVIWLNYTRGFDGVASGQYAYEKVDLKVQKTFRTRHFGTPSITIKAGYATGSAPGSVLYNGNGGKAQYIPLEAANSFQTMKLGEFLSSKFVAIYYSHILGTININKRYSTPEFIVTTSAGWGSLTNPERHRNYPYQTMDNGYYESGLVIRDFFRVFHVVGFGVGGFYRYGYYASQEPIENLAIKLSLKFSIK